MTIADVRVILADIPVKRPHTMSFTTLTAVNFVFVRLETSDGLVGWGEAACLGGPTWSEESAESIAATVERYIAPWLIGRDATQIEALNQEMARRLQGNPFARAAVEMALWDLNGRSLGVPVHRLLGGRVRERVPLSWSLAVAHPDAEVAEAEDKVARGHRIFKIKTAAYPLAQDLERVRRIREAVGPAGASAWTPTRAGTGRARSAPFAPSSPTTSTLSSSPCRARISPAWPRSRAA
jgi:muconate cycloisomerase